MSGTAGGAVARRSGRQTRTSPLSWYARSAARKSVLSKKGMKYVGYTVIGDTRYVRYEKGRDALEIPVPINKKKKNGDDSVRRGRDQSPT